MKSVSRNIYVLATVAIAVGVGLGTVALGRASAEGLKARMSFHWTPRHPAGKVAEEFVKRVNERAKGRLTIETFPSGQLFGIRQTLGAVSSRAVEMGGIVGIVSFTAVNKNYSVVALPGFFKNYAHQRGFWTDTEAGRRVWREIQDKAGIVVLAADPIGATLMASTKSPLDSLESLEGVHARALVKLERPMWKAFKAAKIVSIPTGEMYTALQSGLVDTFQTVAFAIPAFSWDERVKAVQLPYTAFNDGYLIANKKWFLTLSQDLRELLLEIGREITAESTRRVMKMSAAVLKKLQKHGVSVTTLEGAELAKMQRVRAASVGKAIIGNLDPDVAAAVRIYAGDH